MSRPWPDPRTGVFYVRRKVHPQLRPFMGCSEYKRSLETKDPEEALQRYPEALAQSNAAFALAKKAAAGHAELDEADAKQLAGRWFRAESEALESSGDWSKWLVTGKEPHPDIDEHAERLDGVLVGREEESAWLKAVVVPVVVDTMKAHGLAMPPEGSPLYEQLVKVFRAHVLKLSDWALANWAKDGEYLEVPRVMPRAPLSVELKQEEEAKTRKPGEAVDIVHAPACNVYLRDVLEDWAQNGKPGKKPYPVKTVNKYKLAVTRFEALTNNPSIDKVDRVCGTAFRRAMLSLEGEQELSAPIQI